LLNTREFIPCPVCESLAYDVWIQPQRVENDPKKLYGAASGIKGVQQLVRCTTCSMIYENPRLSEEAIISGYMASEDSDHDSQYLMRKKSFYRALLRNRKNLPKVGSKVLDIGTAGGAFLEAAQEFGYDPFGLEPSVDLVNRGNARGLKIFAGTIENNELDIEKFNLICLWDVIEHLANPESSLLLAKKHLSTDGVVLINFPDIGTIQSKFAGKKFWWIISVHLHHFSKRTLDQICKKVGLIPVSKRRYFQVLEFGYLIEIASKLGVPFASTINRVIPKKIKSIPLAYYASQTTAVYKVAK
jgi:SAM-dependent methyltransferase